MPQSRAAVPLFASLCLLLPTVLAAAPAPGRAPAAPPPAAAPAGKAAPSGAGAAAPSPAAPARPASPSGIVVAPTALPSAAPSLPATGKRPSSYVDNVTGMAFVLVEGGCFRMGNPSPLAEPDETPAHEVCLSDFYMASCEVTQGDWEKVLGWVPSRFKGNRRNPVEGVSRIDAQSFIAAMNEKTGRNYRLPTEAEWEYAARGGAKGAGAEAVDLDRVAWYQDSADGETHPAGEMEPNALGIHDMLGNVWEWCSDGYDPSYYRRSPKKDPKGPATAKEHVVRGGAWSDPATHVRVTERGALYADDRSETNGFRLVFTP